MRGSSLPINWKHEFKEGDVLLKSDQIGNAGRARKINSGDTYSTSGWLNTYTAGGIDDGEYSIKSTTKISMENGHGFSEDLPSVSKTTRFTVGE